MLEKLTNMGFEIRFESHAAAILQIDFPTAVKELETALSKLTLPITEIIGSGGGFGQARNMRELQPKA